MDIFYPIQILSDLVSYDLLNLTKDSYVAHAVNFFIYDTVKIGLLLLLINFVMAGINYYFPMEKARDILTRKRWFGMNYLLAALLGIVTPFCSCSSIPLFIGFLGAGIPLGITFAFLISSPLINESSLYLFPAIFGWKVTILYNLFGLAIAVLGGMLIQKLNLEKYVIIDFLKFKTHAQIDVAVGKNKSRGQLIRFFWQTGWRITKRIFPYVVLGIGVAAGIHGFVPSNLVEHYLSAKSWWAVPMAVLFGVPLYANSVTVLPIMEALVGKGASLGAVLSFMTAIVTLSLPEAIILKKVMRWPLLAIFFGITTFGIVIMGYLFNMLQGLI